MTPAPIDILCTHNATGLASLCSVQHVNVNNCNKKESGATAKKLLSCRLKMTFLPQLRDKMCKNVTCLQRLAYSGGVQPAMPPPLSVNVLHTFACWNINVYVSVCTKASASGALVPTPGPWTSWSPSLNSKHVTDYNREYGHAHYTK